MTQQPEQSSSLELQQINLQTNIGLCLNFGYKTLISAKDEMDYRNALINVHNGVELLMKFYLKSKNELIIFEKIDPELLLYNNKDLLEKFKKKEYHTITWVACIKLLKYFSKFPDQYSDELEELNGSSNRRKHFEYYSSHSKTWKILIAYIYPFIKGLISELNLSINDFIKKDYTDDLDKFKKHIDDKIMHKILKKTVLARKHFFEELTDEERLQKSTAQNYTKNKYDKLITCPACDNDALLTRKLKKSFSVLPDGESFVIKSKLLIGEFSCHYCGLNFTNYDQLKYQFKEEEEILADSLVRHYADDFDDCPDDCDCPEKDNDCPDDCNYDCPEEDDDCPDDCNYDCPEEDDDCPDDCNHDCPEEDDD